TRRSVMQKATPTSDRIGPYRVLRQLSVMGSVQVHLACEEGPVESARNVVLKVVPNASGEGARDIEELASEARVCAKLTHPGIVRTRHFFQLDDALVFVAEHIDAISLSALLAAQEAKGQRAFSDDAAFYIGISVCDALAHAHAIEDEKGALTPIIHRAVSPS